MTANSGDDSVNKRLSFFLTAILVGAAVLTGALFVEKKSAAAKIRPSFDMTDEEILTLPYFDLIAPKDENKNLPSDVGSYSLGDGIIHLILPDDVPQKAIIVYIRDIEGNHLARRVYDFTGKVMIGPWEVVIDHHTLPVLYFESENPSDYSFMNASKTKDVICNGNFHICVSKEDADKYGWYRDYLSLGENRASKISASLQGRGSVSWESSNTKKSYSLRLGKAQNLLGMGSNRNWNLIGNGFDVSLLKNVTFNELSRRIGIDYQPNMQNIDLYVDGKYQGVYTLTTKVSADKDRIPLHRGDFLYRLDPPIPEAPIRYTSDAWFRDGSKNYPVADLMYPAEPKEEDITDAAAILQTFVTLRDDSKLPGLAEICDLKSLAAYYWMQELSMNYDACSRSVYFYYTRNDSKIHFGPVWDMDFTLGSPYEKKEVDFSSPEGWKIRELGWYKALFSRPEFVHEVNDLYYNGGIREIMLSGGAEFARQRELVGDDGYLNYLFFGHANPPVMSLVYGDSYDEYCDNMIVFYNKRAAWIDAAMEAEK